MNLKKIKQDLLRFLGNALLSSLANVLCYTLKIRRKNSEGIDLLREQNKNFILVFWHGSMLIPWYVHRSQKLVALVSKSKDGELLARLLEKWHYIALRGSSNDGGKEALFKIQEYSRKNNSLCITPDGPRGPAHKFKAGAVITAVRTGTPLVLCGVNSDQKRVLKSWDKFEIPKFFSEVTLLYSEPMYFDKNLTRDAISDLILKCEDKLNMLHDEAGKPD